MLDLTSLVWRTKLPASAPNLSGTAEKSGNRYNLSNRDCRTSIPSFPTPELGILPFWQPGKQPSSGGAVSISSASDEKNGSVPDRAIAFRKLLGDSQLPRRECQREGRCVFCILAAVPRSCSGFRAAVQDRALCIWDSGS
jgi:hypothetical protein